ncbi:MAG: GFA family protein [Sideroxydans sp.]|nr:GFA family protein [Sideroxydans sp.]
MRGKCLCGQVEFEIDGAIPNFYQCHCSLCKKQSGSSSNTATLVGSEHLRWLAGQEIISSWVKDNGFRSDFCSRCGSPVPNPLSSAPYYWIPVGLLDDELQRTIAAHLFVGSKAGWDVIAQTGTQYETMPGLPEFIKTLHAAT